MVTVWPSECDALELPPSSTPPTNPPLLPPSTTATNTPSTATATEQLTTITFERIPDVQVKPATVETTVVVPVLRDNRATSASPVLFAVTTLLFSVLL